MMKIFKTCWMSVVGTLCIVSTSVASMESRTMDDFTTWLRANRQATVTWKPGDVITKADAEKVRPFLPFGFEDEMIFDGMEMVIKETSDLSPANIYKKATKQHQGKVSLSENGMLEGYVAGEPFDHSTLHPEDPQSGQKAIWNYVHRWQNAGLAIKKFLGIWVTKGGNHDTHEIMRDPQYKTMFGGGGTFKRVISGLYQRAYFSHRADLAENKYQESGRWSKNTLFRELTSFDAPFDIAGTAFIVVRHDDQQVPDDGWAYVPSLRRVRRISAETKTDSLLGTDHTIEDFYCFAGRVVDHDWKYMGTAQILAVVRSRNYLVEYDGPNGWVPKDDWELRDVHVLQQIPKSSSHPYSSKIIFTNGQTSHPLGCHAFDQSGKLWKLWVKTKAWTEDYSKFQEVGTPKNIQIPGFQSINVIDLQNDRGTLFPLFDYGYPTPDIRKLKRKFDVNYLTKGR